MRKLGIRSLAVVLSGVAAVAVSACGGDDDGGAGSGREGGSITVAQTSQPDALDPALAYDVTSWEPVWLVYTPPVTYKRAEGREGTELIPGVAEALPKVSDDGRTYTFRIREGLQYSNGKPVKASDFEHTIKRVLNLESSGSFLFEGIEGAEDYVEAGEAEGDISGIETNDSTREVTIKLAEPDATFMHVLAMNFAGIVPGDTAFRNLSKDPPPGVGPYRFTRSAPNREFVMEKTRGFDIPDIPKGNIDRITTKIVTSEQRQTQDVINGKLDYMQDPPPTDLLPEVRSKYADRYEEHSTVSTYYFFMNQRTPPFDKKQVREAVNYAVDSKALARLFGGRLEPSCNFLPSNMTGYEKLDPCPWGDPNEPGDLQKARELIEKANVDGDSVTVYTNSDSNRPQIGEYYTDLLNKIGLKAKLKTVDGGIYGQTVGNQRERAQTGLANWFQDFPHPANFLSVLSGEAIQPTNNENYGNVDDPAITKEIEELKREPNLESVADRWADVDRKVVEGAHVAPYGSEKASTFLSERMDFENCSRFHPVYQNDYSSFCLK
jgi:peptide/nickel transport system substrate-binding protein